MQNKNKTEHTQNNSLSNKHFDTSQVEIYSFLIMKEMPLMKWMVANDRRWEIDESDVKISL